MMIHYKNVIQLYKMYRESSTFFILNTSKSYTTNMATLVILKHPVTILITGFTNPDNLTDDLLILSLPSIYLSLH